MIFSPDTSTSLEIAAGSSHAEFNAQMTAGSRWVLIGNVAFWWKQGAHAALGTSGASAGAGSMYVPAGQFVYVDPSMGADVSVINDGSAGKCSLTRVKTF